MHGLQGAEINEALKHAEATLISTNDEMIIACNGSTVYVPYLNDKMTIDVKCYLLSLDLVVSLLNIVRGNTITGNVISNSKNVLILYIIISSMLFYTVWCVFRHMLH